MRLISDILVPHCLRNIFLQKNETRRWRAHTETHWFFFLLHELRVYRWTRGLSMDGDCLDAADERQLFSIHPFERWSMLLRLSVPASWRFVPVEYRARWQPSTHSRSILYMPSITRHLTKRDNVIFKFFIHWREKYYFNFNLMPRNVRWLSRDRYFPSLESL